MRQQLTACQCPRHTRRIRNIILGPSPTPIFLTLEIIATLPLAFYSDPRIPGSPDPWIPGSGWGILVWAMEEQFQLGSAVCCDKCRYNYLYRKHILWCRNFKMQLEAR